MEQDRIDHEPWPERALFLPLVGALLGLVFHLLIDRPGQSYGWTEDPLRIGAASAVVVGGAAFGLTVERLRWLWSVLFAAAAGLVVGGVFYWNGSPGGRYASDEWQLVAILLAIAIAAPLFQAARDRSRWAPDYAAVHSYAWGNVVLWFAGLGFVLISYLLAQLLGALFDLIGLTLVRDLVRKEWFVWVLAGAALGAAFAILRDRDKVLGILQRVVMTILSVLAPILAAGLAIFVLALPFTGLAPLWERTSATTPVLLSCVIGAVILANAIVGNGPEEEARGRLLRASAFTLSIVLLPLAAVAAVSTWLRIDQHGFTPERLWGMVFVGVALLTAFAYALAVIIGRRRWMATLRNVNMQLAIAVCVIAFLLALPLVNFGAISTRDQLGRLQSGEVSPEQFDWAALAFDFGPSGREAVRHFAERGATAAIRQEAKRALASPDRWAIARPVETAEPLGERLRVRPQEAPLPETLRAALARPGVCGGAGTCDLFWTPGAATAVAVYDACGGRTAEEVAERPEPCLLNPRVLVERNGEWHDAGESAAPMMERGHPGEIQRQQQRRAAVARGDVEVREVTRRQLYIGGEPVGSTFD